MIIKLKKPNLIQDNLVGVLPHNGLVLNRDRKNYILTSKDVNNVLLNSKVTCII